jgi:hypothetical protein
MRNDAKKSEKKAIGKMQEKMLFSRFSDTNDRFDRERGRGGGGAVSFDKLCIFNIKTDREQFHSAVAASSSFFPDVPMNLHDIKK